MKAAARTILQDWNGGKIGFYTVPPARDDIHVGAAIVSSWGSEFDLNSILSSEESMMSRLPTQVPNMMEIAPGVPSTLNFDEEEMDDEEEMESSEGEMEDEEEAMEDEQPPVVLQGTSLMHQVVR